MSIDSIAYVIQPDGAAERQPLAEAQAHSSGCALVWLHIDGKDEACMAWLRERSGIPAAAIAALSARETRPRATPLEQGVLLNLRGVNASPEADPEDLVSIRLWAEDKRVVTVSFTPLLAVEDLAKVVEDRRVRDPGDLIVRLAEGLTIRLEKPIDDLSDSADGLEDSMIGGETKDLRERIAKIRRTAIGLRRYISPQRDALSGLIAGHFQWLHDDDRIEIGEAVNRVTRLVEELDSVRERAAVMTEQLADIRAEAMNERSLVLTVAGTVFLPLTFLTGLFGMNVHGIPFNEHGQGFWIIAGLCVVLGAGLWIWMRRADVFG